MSVQQTAPLAIRAPVRPARTGRRKLRRLYVRICRKLRPVFEIAAFLAAAFAAIIELFSGRLPSFSTTEVSCPPEPEPTETVDGTLGPYPIHD